MGKKKSKETKAAGLNIRDRIVGLVKVPANQIVPSPHNWRTHPESQAKALRGVLAEIGFAGAVLCRKAKGKLFCIDGHLRLETMGAAEVPCLVTDLSENEAKLVLATFDPIGAMATADKGKLDALLRDVQTDSEAIAAMLEDLAIDNGILPPGVEPGGGGDDFDATPDQGPTRTNVGELWVIGGVHRLLVGDCTVKENVGRLMGGEKAGLMNTDPPYGIAYANDDRPNPGVAKPRVANDELTDENLQAFLEAAFKAAVDAALALNAAWYLWHAHLTQGYFAAAAAAANVVLHRQIIWVKPVLLLGRGQYHWKHEPCFMGWVKGNQPPDYGLGNGERTQTTVWEIGSITQAERKEFNHSSPKPVDLFTTPITKHLKENEIAFEPFAGSGPQFIAAHRLNRRCYGLEIEPRYADVILKRAEAEGLTCELAPPETTRAKGKK